MKLPALEHPQCYRGLYIYDFGEWVAVGYTAEEIAMLLESEAYRGGKVYKIHRAEPDGYMELRGVPPERFQLESGMFFCRSELEMARADYAELASAAQRHPPPCRAFVHLAERSGVPEFARYVTALIYPAEYEDEVAQWLLSINYMGGQIVEGGISHVSNYYAQQVKILERKQLWGQPAVASRSAEEVFATVREPVQRRLVVA
jgi:hypothetical protein